MFLGRPLIVKLARYATSSSWQVDSKAGSGKGKESVSCRDVVVPCAGFGAGREERIMTMDHKCLSAPECCWVTFICGCRIAVSFCRDRDTTGMNHTSVPGSLIL